MGYNVQAILRAAPYVVDPRTGYAIWFGKPLAIISELGATKHIDVGMAHFFFEEADKYLKSIGATGEKRIGIHDWSTMTGYDAAARSAFIEYVSQHKALITHSSVILPQSTPLGRVGIRTASTVLSLIGQPLEFPKDVSVPLLRFGVRVSTR